MRAEVMAVGTELLLGQIANTNAQRISEALSAIGVDVYFHSVVGDNEERVAGSIALALERAEVLIITGGLGPTHDDLTREAIARVTGRPLERRADLERDLRKRFEQLGRVMADANLRQADQPRGATAIPNPRGTAPGVAIDHNGKWIYALPGIPLEMEGMLHDFVVPELRKTAGASMLHSRLINVIGVPESEIAERLRPIVQELDRTGAVTAAMLPGSGEVKVRLTVKAQDLEEAEAAIEPVESEIKSLLGASVYGVDDATLAGTVGEMMRRRGLTLALAESVTGGLLSSMLVSVPGTSEFLNAAYVVYDAKAKMEDVGVSRETLERHGAVSEPAVIEMAEGARKKADADVGVSTSGEAGPEPAEAPVGTLFIGLAWEGGSTTRSFRAPARDRDVVRLWAAKGALNLLRLWLLGETG
ncbi:MAG: competence/damage-inducible protein A [Actinomycetota bacterium]